MVLLTSTNWILVEEHKTTKKEEAIITIASAFENFLTLPLITFHSM
jgi:hypothetical protein